MLFGGQVGLVQAAIIETEEDYSATAIEETIAEHTAAGETTEKSEDSGVGLFFPYQDTFIISAYYSPLVGQEKYVTGSYEGDIRLNGSGVNSADNTPVYPGMIAAPSLYPFGLKMEIPGLGVGTVHDRGGAIVKAGERGNAYDRLDVWMGYGDDGLKRALTWGKRTVEVTVYAADDPIEENFYLGDFQINENLFLSSVVKLFQPTYFPNDLWYLSESEKVGELQYYLKKLGYYAEPITNFYGQKTLEAVFAFQIDNEVVENWNDLGAGHLGIKTRRTLETEIDRLKREEDDELEFNLGRDDEGDDVRKLQEALVTLGYLNDEDISGEYDQKTIEAVFDFQVDNEVISTEYETGAGYYGPKTHAALEENLEEVKMGISPIELAEEIQAHEDLKEDLDYFTEGLQFGDNGPKVIKLQDELRQLGYFRLDSTGTFGEITEHALFKLQQRFELVEDEDSPGAGYLGPQTRERLNGIIGRRIETKRYLAVKRGELQQSIYLASTISEADLLVSPEVEAEGVDSATSADLAAAETSKETAAEAADMDIEDEEVNDEAADDLIVSSLAEGDRGDEVEILQKLLRDLGFFKGLTSQYFGNSTKKAVIAFQLDRKIIDSEEDSGAGLVGPITMGALNL